MEIKTLMNESLTLVDSNLLTSILSIQNPVTAWVLTVSEYDCYLISILSALMAFILLRMDKFTKLTLTRCSPLHCQFCPGHSRGLPPHQNIWWSVDIWNPTDKYYFSFYSSLLPSHFSYISILLQLFSSLQSFVCRILTDLDLWEGNIREYRFQEVRKCRLVATSPLWDILLRRLKKEYINK